MKHLKWIQPLVMILMLTSPVMVFATGPGFDNDVKNWNDDENHDQDDDNCDDDYNEIPLDGGLSVLAAAGAAYGIKRVRDKKKK
ncbi:MAG: hypothetical protein H6550_13560 [Chitinophagales bacterium]|nr:hypothetical protein [Chitinophagales bacterium]